MGSIMQGVLNMPEDVFWNDDPVVRFQHNVIRLEAAKTIEQLQKTNQELLEALEGLMESESRGRIMPIGAEWDASRAAIANAKQREKS